MTLDRVRRSSRLVAVMLLLAMFRGAVHLAQDDFACAPASGSAYQQHAETDHQLVSGDQPADEHCALCHWVRTLRAPRAVLAGWVAHLAAPTLLDRAPVRVHGTPFLPQLAPRAPPARL